MTESTPHKINVCHGFACSKRKANIIMGRLRQHFLGSSFDVRPCACTGNCDNGNNVVVNGTIIHGQSPDRAVKCVQVELDRQSHEAKKEVIPISEGETEDILGL